MTINSYFYDSVMYSSLDFANAFGIIMETGILNNTDGTLGFDIDSAGNPTIYAGKAVVNGRFVELTETEKPTIPTGSYNGQIVLKVDSIEERKASIVANTHRIPTQNINVYELPLYDIVVTNGSITTITDKRVKGGVVSKEYTKSEVDTKLETKVNFYEDTDGSLVMQRASSALYGTATANGNFLISIQDTAHAHNYMIGIGHFQANSYFNFTILASNVLTSVTNTLGTISVSGLAGTPKFTIHGLGGGV
jgi:hypothetical protein